jgi:hypothetical protein
MNQAPEQQQAHPAQVAQEFMRRTDMKGGEVEAYAQTFNWLQAILSGELVVNTKEAHTALVTELKELREFKRENSAAEERAEGEESGELPVLEPAVPALELEDVDSED